MSLEPKAKTLMQDLKVIFKTSGLGTRTLLFKDVFEYCRNTSKDAQQEIDKLQADFKAIFGESTRQRETIEKLVRERGLQKQKIEHLWETLPLEYNVEIDEVTDLGSKRQWREWLAKFKELLRK